MPTIQFEISGDRVKAMCASTTEDLWHDFLYFEARAATLDSPSDEMLRLRYLRAAVVVLYSYVEGVVNEWCAKLHSDNRFGPTAMVEFALRNKSKRHEFQSHGPEVLAAFIRYICLELKCEFVSECATSIGHSLKTLDVWSFKKDVRDGYAHPKPGKDFALIKSLSDKPFKEIKTETILWLDNVARSLGFSRHLDTRAVMERINWSSFGSTQVVASSEPTKST